MLDIAEFDCISVLSLLSQKVAEKLLAVVVEVIPNPILDVSLKKSAELLSLVILEPILNDQDNHSPLR